MKKRLALLALVAALASGAAPSLAGTAGSAGPASAQTSFLSPELFAEFSTGIGLVRIFNCAGVPTAEGTGFLVGASVVMTARHVVRGACHVKVLLDGHWMTGSHWTSWSTPGRGDVNTADVATIRLVGAASGHVFPIRSWSPAVGVNLAALGHPLGNEISLTQGHVVDKGKLSGIPILAVRLLGAEGASGSPLVDDVGNVVGILQKGLGGADALGQHTSGLILGIDLPSWWPTIKTNLCAAYVQGGLPGCGGTPAPKPAQQYTVDSCWIQYTGGLPATVNRGSALTSLSLADLLARGPENFWALVSLSAPAPATIKGVTATLIGPNNVQLTAPPFAWPAGETTAAGGMAWKLADGSPLFQQSAAAALAGNWKLTWSFPDGLSCSTTFTVTA
jgi:hypothetical protein